MFEYIYDNSLDYKKISYTDDSFGYELHIYLDIKDDCISDMRFNAIGPLCLLEILNNICFNFKNKNLPQLYNYLTYDNLMTSYKNILGSDENYNTSIILFIISGIC